MRAQGGQTGDGYKIPLHMLLYQKEDKYTNDNIVTKNELNFSASITRVHRHLIRFAFSRLRAPQTVNAVSGALQLSPCQA